MDLRAHRWNRIFRPDGRTVIFAMDHAAAFGMMEGIEKPGEVVKRVADGGADAILTTFGIAKNFGKEIGKWVSYCAVTAEHPSSALPQPAA